MSEKEILAAVAPLIPYGILIQPEGEDVPCLLRGIGFDWTGCLMYNWGTKYSDNRSTLFSEKPFKVYLRRVEDMTDMEKEVSDEASADTLSLYLGPAMKEEDIWKVTPGRQWVELRWYLENHIDVFGLLGSGELGIEISITDPPNNPYMSREYEDLMEKSI